MSKDVILGNVSTCKSSCAVSDMPHVMDRPCVRHTECNVCCRMLHVAPVRCLLAKAWRMSRISPGLRRFALGAGILHGTIDSPGYSRVLKATVIRVLQGATKRGRTPACRNHSCNRTGVPRLFGNETTACAGYKYRFVLQELFRCVRQGNTVAAGRSRQRCMYTVATGDDSATGACDATCVGQRATVHTRRTTTRSMQQTTHAQPKPCCFGAQPCCIGAQPCCIGARRRCCGGSDSCDAAVNADSWFAKDKNGTPFAFSRYSIVLIINQSYVKTFFGHWSLLLSL